MKALQRIPALLEKKRRSLALRKLARRPRFARGRISIAGWDLEYLDSASLASSIDVLVQRGWNDFRTKNEAPRILDCGANVGVSVLNYLRKHPRASITAFEPDPAVARTLRRNLSVNGALDVRVLEAAVWTETTRASFLPDPGGDGGRIIAQEEQGSSLTVECVDLRDYLVEPVDLLKVDLEGAEFQIIPHVADHLALVKNVVVECHISNRDVKPFARLLEVLAQAGFSVSVNSCGQWRDLVRRPDKLPNEFDQYLLVAAWR